MGEDFSSGGDGRGGFENKGGRSHGLTDEGYTTGDFALYPCCIFDTNKIPSKHPTDRG